MCPLCIHSTHSLSTHSVIVLYTIQAYVQAKLTFPFVVKHTGPTYPAIRSIQDQLTASPAWSLCQTAKIKTCKAQFSLISMIHLHQHIEQMTGSLRYTSTPRALQRQGQSQEIRRWEWEFILRSAQIQHLSLPLSSQMLREGMGSAGSVRLKKPTTYASIAPLISHTTLHQPLRHAGSDRTTKSAHTNRSGSIKGLRVANRRSQSLNGVAMPRLLIDSIKAPLIPSKETLVSISSRCFRVIRSEWAGPTLICGTCGGISSRKSSPTSGGSPIPIAWRSGVQGLIVGLIMGGVMHGLEVSVHFTLYL
jgi:hypothetical protein